MSNENIHNVWNFETLVLELLCVTHDVTVVYSRHMCFELMGGRLASAPAMLGKLSRNKQVLGRTGEMMLNRLVLSEQSGQCSVSSIRVFKVV